MKVIWDYLTKDDKLYMIGQVSLDELRQELVRRLEEDDDKDLEEGEEEEVVLETPKERYYAYWQLRSKYDLDFVHDVFDRKVEVPKWLQKEILERRKERR